jgi:GT2 family glycosyltransferase
MEEIDFCHRVWNKGYKVMFVSDSIIYHKGAATAGRDLYKKRYWEHRNNLLVWINNLSEPNLQMKFITRTILELATYFYYLGTGQFQYIRSLFSATHYILK